MTCSDFSNGPALVNIEEIDGGAGNDTIYRHRRRRHDQWGQKGNDTITGGAGNDTLDGGQEAGHTGVPRFQARIHDQPERKFRGYTAEDQVEGRDGTDTFQNFEFFQFQDRTVGISDLMNPAELKSMGAPEISGEELLFAMESGAGSEMGQGLGGIGDGSGYGFRLRQGQRMGLDGRHGSGRRRPGSLCHGPYAGHQASFP